MLPTQSSLFCSPINISFPFRKSPETRHPLLSRPQKSNVLMGLKTCNGCSEFNSPVLPFRSELPKHLKDDCNVAGIGITNFFQGKNIFITGATGLLGKVLLEKILRSTRVGKVYVLIKAKDKEDALDRLEKEIIKSDLFEWVRQKHGESFLRERMIPVLGNICEPNIGMDSLLVDDVRNNVDIIIESAGSTDFNERYDLLLDINVYAPQRLMRFAKSCKNLKLFAHISTAYVNGIAEGMILEEPLKMGDNRREGEFPRLDVADEINMVFKSSIAASFTDNDISMNLKKLGQERAEFYGWHNTYTLTKAMGEMVLNEIRGDVPVVIIRPSIIESSYKEPFPGWIQGNRMCDPIIISYGKGEFPAVTGNPEVIVDIIPVDIVANTTIAAMAREGSVDNPRLSVYHVASSVENPLTLSNFFEYLHEHFSSNPLIESQSVGRIKFCDNMEDFSRYTLEEILRGTSLEDMSFTTDKRMIQRIQRQCKAKAAYAEQLCKMYEFIGFFNASFDTGNTVKLMKEMSREERVEFEVNVASIDWKHYLQHVHVQGLKKRVLNGTG